MFPITRIEQLKNAGIIDDTELGTPEGKILIESITDEEFRAILTVHAKISDDLHRHKFEQAIHVMGF